MGTGSSRRTVLKRTGALTAVGVAGLAGCLGGDQEADVEGETLRIGAFQPVSGDLQYYGEISLMGFYSGLAYKYGESPDDVADVSPGEYEFDPEDGPTYEIYLEDTELSVDTAQRVTEDLVVDHDVDVLFGGTLSESARRVIGTTVAEADIPYIVGPAADADITNSAEHCHEKVFRASEHTAMDARAGGRFVAEETDATTIAIMHIDDAFGRSVANNWQAVLEAEGLDVLDPRGVDSDFTEFEGLFDEAVADGADGVVGGFTAIQLPAFLSTGIGYDVQLFGGFADLLTTQLIGDTVEAELGEDFTEDDVRDAGLGPFTSRYHWNQYDDEINDEFIDMHVDAYGMVPDLFSGGTFVGGSALVQAVEESESTDGDDIADAMRGMTVEDTPKGEGGYVFQESNNQAASEMTVAWPVPTDEEFAETWGAAVMPGEPIATLDAEEVMVPADELDCDLG
ncbi:ABC transporter substrate-binding protein [Halovivax sp.]|uniref:ABC transporter substrate-binding protein n=1 Tax=Halovivax sp. TaxID=1935978 RepID=UPI0037439525